MQKMCCKTFKKKVNIFLLNEWQIQRIEGYAKKGKHKKGDKNVLKGLQIQVSFSCKKAIYENQKDTLGFFVLASNDTHQRLSPEQKLNGYKDQNKAGKGFLFLKDPAFLAANIFVKKPERVEATLMIMTLCLLVYASLEKELRIALEE